MKLYLSSYRMGDHVDELLTLVGTGARVGVISNALDYIPDAARVAYTRDVFDPVAFLNAQGFDAIDLDLREYFDRPDSLRQSLRTFQLVFAVGGNAFLLLRAMRASGFDKHIGALLAEDRIVYGGWSAGAVVTAPHLRGIELMDEPHITADGYPSSDPPWEGLGLVDFTIVPHFQSGHSEAAAAEKTAAYMAGAGISHLTLRDGEVIIVRGKTVEVRPAKI